ncbi:CstA-like transporter-associated (seleno)protein [Sinosporangium siamense]|uniref:YbdD/YjiX family protein n=1 Tax=Sinosporangium siamense TaxID=1367973 RepID=A0A919RLN8_9ACTN|nr:CstA-like transporter-associated (seleno)protein [Sinosporangium siamense]GII94421.1 hypothetical protein Ssi02_46520 [Sinosporangium siamense]
MKAGAVLRFLRWYLREVTGEGEYDKYLARHTHGTPLSRREFERRRSDQREKGSAMRCC